MSPPGLGSNNHHCCASFFHVPACLPPPNHQADARTQRSCIQDISRGVPCMACFQCRLRNHSLPLAIRFCFSAWVFSAHLTKRPQLLHYCSKKDVGLPESLLV